MNICVAYGLKVPKSQWEMPPKAVVNSRAKILSNFKFQTDKQLLTNQRHIVVDDKEQKTAAVRYVV